jgi:putative exosortase-associated protein (TIGR04073 family)
MRNLSKLFLTAGTAAIFCVGCAGPEEKLGRGLTNIGEVYRWSEMSRAIEQAGISDGPDFAPTTGVVRGATHSLRRTFVGLWEIATFPIPNGKFKDYGPILKPTAPGYPSSYRPGLFADSIFATDTSLGFSGGDIAPMFPGSRFKVYEP